MQDARGEPPRADKHLSRLCYSSRYISREKRCTQIFSQVGPEKIARFFPPLCSVYAGPYEATKLVVGFRMARRVTRNSRRTATFIALGAVDGLIRVQLLYARKNLQLLSVARPHTERATLPREGGRSSLSRENTCWIFHTIIIHPYVSNARHISIFSLLQSRLVLASTMK